MKIELPDDLRDMAYSRAGGMPSDPNYDPALLALMIEAADELDRLYNIIDGTKELNK